MPDCRNWSAWRDHHPRPGPVFRVQAECKFPAGGFSVELRKPGSRVPEVRGPALCARTAGPPAFDVAIENGRFYSLEVTSDLALFAERDTNGWTADKAYATWQDGELLSERRVSLPASAWTRLKNSDCLFYRIRTSSERNAWKDVTAVPPPSETRDVPLTAIVDSVGDLERPDRLVLFRLVIPPAGTSVAGETTVRVTYSEQGGEGLRNVTILPDGLTLDVDDVF